MSYLSVPFSNKQLHNIFCRYFTNWGLEKGGSQPTIASESARNVVGGYASALWPISNCSAQAQVMVARRDWE